MNRCASPYYVVLRAVVAWAVVIWCLPASAVAQGSATLNRFSASETAEDDFHLSRPIDSGHIRFGATLHLDYANDPLVYEDSFGDADSERVAIVGDQLNATLGLSFGVADRITFFAGLPVVMIMDGDTDPALATVADDGGPGDLYLGARARFVGDSDDTVAFGLQVTGTFPTAGDQRFRGDEFLSLHPELLLELRPGPVRVVVDLGARIRENVGDENTNLSFGDELTFGLGVAVPVWTHDNPATHLDLHVQVYGSSEFDGFFDRAATPVEGTAGVKFFHDSGIVAGVAAGPGLARGFGSPDLRFVGMLGWAMPRAEEIDSDGDGLLDSEDDCPQEPEDVDTFEDENGCPDPDNDRDSILDVDDQCPLEPENDNDYEDEDGCPDEAPAVDTDGDGIFDPDDQCIDSPEDFDSFEDEDGCPDPDNDADGVLDTADECPLEPGPVENRGCPDSDRDGDTVVDRLDNCPDEPGPPENQGCVEEQQVRITEGRIEILDKVYFRTSSHIIQPRSHALLMNVASVLNNHPEIEQVVVEGHTDSRGRRQYNVDLSQRRAESVVTFLTTRGDVEAGRLQARGFGPDQPIVENARSRDEHAQNRRVEFNIPSGADDIEREDSGPGGQGTVDR